MKKSVNLIMLLILSAIIPFDSNANSVTQVELILDASRSMRDPINGVSKISMAKEAISRLADDLGKNENIHMGLRIFGHLNKSCTNSLLEIPIGKIKPEVIKKKISGIVPIGNTPIGYSLIKAADDFNRSINGEKIIFIITDGNENCKNNPCEIALKIKKAGITAKVHIVGLGVGDSELNQLKCIAGPSGGMVIRVNNLKELKKGIDELIGPETLAKDAKPIPSSNNLVVTGIDLQENRIFISVEVIQNNRVMASSDGESVGFSLSEGAYSLKVKSVKSGQIIMLDNVSIRNDAITRRSLKFGEAELIMTTKDINGNKIDTSIQIFKAGSEELIVKKERVELMVDSIRLAPGLYDIKVRDLDTGHEKALKDFKLTFSKNRSDLIFERGTLVIQARSSKGVVKITAIETYKSGSKFIVKKSSGEKIHRHILYPGLYDIKINDWYGKGEEWLRNVKISNGDTVTKEAVFIEPE